MDSSGERKKKKKHWFWKRCTRSGTKRVQNLLCLKLMAYAKF